MADTLFQIDIMGEKQISMMLEGVEYRCQDLRPVWEYVADDFRMIEERQFAGEGAFGRPWPALSPLYAAWKAKNFPGAKILERTGALRDSLTGMGAGHIDERQPDSLRLGTSVHYGGYHQTGTRRMPPRPPIVIPEEAKRRWAKAIHAYLKGGDLFEAMERTSLFGGG